MPPFLRRPRSNGILIFSALITVFIVYAVITNHYTLKNLVSYSTRPLWDKSEMPSDIIPHYYSEGLKVDDAVCKLHTWTVRGDAHNVKVFDAVLMNNELDLLEIRMNELDSVVDYFLIVESNGTFTGLPKETFFRNNRERFAKFEHKIVYEFLPGYPLNPGQSPWDVEGHTRVTMTSLILSHLRTLPTNTRPLVIMADVDEIPASHTINLLRNCDFGKSLHLQLRDHLYSYEWYIGLSSWRASVQMWARDSYYRHGKSTEKILADAGWHCSFCFRTIGEYALKMKGYSHADRIAGRVDLLDPKRIQDVICSGKDIFGMLPEAYSYLDLFSQMSLRPMKSAVGLPRHLIENSAKYRFLLPQGCHREA